MINELDTENANLNLFTGPITVLTHTPSATKNILCQGVIHFGDGVDDLDGTGGNFELTITVGGQTIEPSPQIVTFSTAVRTMAFTTAFPVLANAEVIIRAKSPNADDDDVDVTAYLYQVESDGNVVKSMRNKRGIIKVGLVWYSVLYDDDGTTIILQRALKDSTGANISDFEAGKLTQELASAIL
jgi:hypothetical protein